MNEPEAEAAASDGPVLEIRDLSVTFAGRVGLFAGLAGSKGSSARAVDGVSLELGRGEVLALAGESGCGKSSLAAAVLRLLPRGTEVTGEVLLDGEDILALEPDERAARGLFLAFQYPMEIPGVATMTFLRTALNAQRKKRGEPELLTPEFLKRVN